MSEAKIMQKRDLLAAISRVSFERSCLDMGWRWEIEDAGRAGPTSAAGGWVLRCSFRMPDRDTGEVSTGFGRWWFVEQGATFSSIAKTMFAAAKMIVEHELLEAFKVDGERPFDPHVVLGTSLTPS